MSFTMEDALESGWVAVRPNVFDEKDKHKFVFIVAWNEVEGKFAVTCHDRTAQRRAARNGEKSPARAESPGRAADSDDAEPAVREHSSWAGLFSFQDVRAVHQQLCSVNSDLEPCVPAFPEEPSAVWTVLFGLPPVSHRDVDALCYQLQVYLGHALDTCGWRILSQVLFAEGDDPDEYYESLSELRQEGYEEALLRAKRRLHEVPRVVFVLKPEGRWKTACAFELLFHSERCFN